MFIIRSFRLLCTVVSLFYVCVVYRHVRIVRTCDIDNENYILRSLTDSASLKLQVY